MKTFFAARKGKIWPVALFVATIIFGLLPILALSFYTRAGADDFSYAWPFVKPAVDAGGNLFDILGAAAATSAYYFETWQGLYSSAFVLALQPSSFSESAYWLTTWILLALSAVAFCAISWAVCVRCLRSSSKAWIGIGLLSWFFFVQTLPDIYEGLYWYNGAFNYLFFWCIFMLVITAALIFLTSSRKTRFWWLVLACALGFILAGGNHVTTTGCIAVLLLLGLWELRHKRSGWLFFAFGVCVFGLCIVASAPGTMIRSDALGVDTSSFRAIAKNLLLSLGNSAWWVAERFGKWSTLSLVAYVVALLPFAAAVGRRAQAVPRVRTQFWAALFFSFFLVFWAPLYLLQVSTRGPGAGRVEDILYASFVVCVAIFTLLAVTTLIKRGYSHLEGFDVEKRPLPAYMLSTAALFVILFSFGSPLGFTHSTWDYTFEDLASGAALTYAQETDTRTAVLMDTPEQDVVFEARTSNPETIANPEYSTDPSFWINRNAAQFYHKNSIALAPTSNKAE